MSEIVLDASMTLSWLLPDEAEPSTRTVQGDVRKANRVWVAGHRCLKVANALCMAERRKRLDVSGIAQAVALFAQLPVTVDPETHQRARADTLVLARQHGMTTYDSAYLEVALRWGASLASLDSELRETPRKRSVPLGITRVRRTVTTMLKSSLHLKHSKKSSITSHRQVDHHAP